VLANAVLLHLTRPELAEFLVRAVPALRTDGLLAFTVKRGNGQAWRTDKLDRPRFFTYWQEPELRTLLKETGWHTLAIDHRLSPSEEWLFVTCQPGDQVGHTRPCPPTEFESPGPAVSS
jgi:hypothetical protein